MSNFQHPGTDGTVSIGSVEPGFSDLTVSAQYNPKELQVDLTVPWSQKSQSNKSNQTGLQLEFTGAQGRSLSLELLFDGYEKKQSIASKVKVLNTLASVIDPTEKDELKRRPHMCVVTWGNTLQGADGSNKFKCVIESLSTKYTMFSEAGDPLRATCTVKLKEADTVTGKASGK